MRSLSTPVTARQKILEETNRNLRRQIASLEEDLRQSNNGENLTDIKSELDDVRRKNSEFVKLIKENEINRTTLVRK